MNELIKITNDATGRPAVSGRELHEFLGVETPYHKWFPRMVEYGFSENQDFGLVEQICPTNNPKNPATTRSDHALSLDMAKEISMIQRTDKGKQARRYFIECEEKLRGTAPSLTANILATNIDYLTTRLKEAESERDSLQSVVDFYEGSDDLFDFDYVATAVSRYKKPPFTPKHFRQWLAARGILTTMPHKNDRPRQEYINRGWFFPQPHTWEHRGRVRHRAEWLFTSRGLNEIIKLAFRESLLAVPNGRLRMLWEIKEHSQPMRIAQ